MVEIALCSQHGLLKRSKLDVTFFKFLLQKPSEKKCFLCWHDWFFFSVAKLCHHDSSPVSSSAIEITLFYKALYFRIVKKLVIIISI